MPAISLFYGVIIYMFYFDNRQHHKPHIHAHYGEFAAVIDIEDGTILEGELPRKKIKLVQAWLEIHRDDLMADWQLAIQGQELFKIDPLR